MTRQPGSTKSFGKAKPAQAPRYIETDPNDYDEFEYNDEPVTRAVPVQTNSNTTIILSVICGLCFLALGGAGFLYFVNSSSSVHATPTARHISKINGTEKFAQKFKACNNRSHGVDKRTRKHRAQFEKAARIISQSSIDGKPRLVICMSGAPAKYFCNNDFREKFNTLVWDFHSSILAQHLAARDMKSLFETVEGLSDGTSHVDFAKHAERKITSLFRAGHLRREEFKGSLSEEPKWLKHIFANFEQPASRC